MKEKLTELLSDGASGWCDITKASYLYDLVISTNSQLSVEVGVFTGHSLLSMALAHKQKSSGLVVGIDPWNLDEALQPGLAVADLAVDDLIRDIDWDKVYNECQQRVIKYELDDYVKLVRDTSVSASKTFAASSVDILHIDGNHTTSSVKSDITAWLPKMKSSGFIVFDDMNWPSVREAVNCFSNNLVFVGLCKDQSASECYRLLKT